MVGEKILGIERLGGTHFNIDPQNDVHYLSVVELAYCFGIAFLPFELRVDLVVDVRREFREVVGAIDFR